jgi:hypothetical protein
MHGGGGAVGIAVGVAVSAAAGAAARPTTITARQATDTRGTAG